MKTIEHIKEKREVPEKLKEEVKEFSRVNRAILKALKEEPMTIPDIASAAKLDKRVVTYHLMTLLKYGKIEVGDIDDMDEYYYYKIKD